MKRPREPQQDVHPASHGGGGSENEDTSAAESQHASKYTELDPSLIDPGDNSDGSPSPTVNMRCFLPPHAEMLSFTSYRDYEAHYNSFHTNRCLECRRNFPSQHLLAVHIEECHDPIVRIKRDQGEHTYSCFVDGCDRKCLTHQKRRMHMIDKHMYPKNFFFAVTRDGIDGRRSLLNDGGQYQHHHRRRRSSNASQGRGARRRAATLEKQPSGQGKEEGEEEEGQESCAAPKEETPARAKTKAADVDVDSITSSMSSLRFVPSAVKFGNKSRPGFSNQ